MGYSTVLTDTGSDLSNQVANWVVGCINPDDPNCVLHDLDHPRYHFSVESWMGAQRRVAGLPQNLRPTLVRSLDFALDDQYFLVPRVLQAELDDEGCGLDQYRCYNARWFTPYRYFDTWEQMVNLLTPEGLELCSTDSDFQPPSSDHYLQVTGDMGSMRRINGTSSYSIECYNDTIWFSPACRHNTTLCVPIMVQYTRQQAMQLAVFHNVPFALVQVKATSKYLDRYYKAALEGRFLFGWYTPDDALIDKSGNMPVMLNWPRHNDLDYQQNIFRTGLSSFYPVQYCWPALPTVGNGADLMYFLKSFDLYDQDVTALMIRSRTLKDQGVDEFAVARRAACEWVQANAARWRLWVPLVCAPGQYPSPTGACEPCPAGAFCSGDGAPAPCPAGAYCPGGSSAPTLCPLGTEQPGVAAAAASACTACRAGYTKTEMALVSRPPR